MRISDWSSDVCSSDLHRAFGGIWLGDQIGEAGMGLARRVAGNATDDLDDLGQAGAIADGQRMFAPNPVEALLRHAQGNDEFHIVAVVLLRRVFTSSAEAWRLVHWKSGW